MPDKREQILVRLLAILESMIGDGPIQFRTVWRDRAGVEPEAEDQDDDGLKETQLPCAILLDGYEEQSVARIGGIAQGGMQPQIMKVIPQIFVILMPRPDARNEGVGPELSAFRTAVFKKIRDNASLMALLGANGAIEYRGCETDMQSGSTVEGQIRLDFAFSYALIPTNLD